MIQPQNQAIMGFLFQERSRELRRLLANLKQEAVQLAKHPKPINTLKH